MELKISGLSKSYGNKRALDQVDITLTEGIYGLLGPNGAGKSTLMNIITGNLTPEGGAVYYNGADTRIMGKAFRSVLGFMPQHQGLYDNFTGFRFLSYIAALKGMGAGRATEEIEKAAFLVNLNDELGKKLGAYSGGMKQRILIAQAILNEPQVLIFDEPTAGLDPKERIRVRNLIAEIALKKIVIIATHVVSDVEYIAKEVILLKKGRVLAKGTPGELLRPLKGRVFEIKTTPCNLRILEGCFKVSSIAPSEDKIIVRVLADAPPVAYDYEEVMPNLEDKYLYEFSR
jgi:ABC-type multidrug transport system ATPase subunit